MKTSIVVGGSKGIGSRISDMFVKRGDKTFVVSRSINNFEGIHIPVDITNIEKTNLAFEKIFKQNPKIDYLVFSQKNSQKPKDNNYEFDFSANAISNIINISKKYFNNNSSIVVLSSPASQFVLNQPLSYHMSKGAIEILVKYYAVKLGKSGIRINSLLPGTVKKKENLDFYNNNTQLTNLFNRIIPLGRQGTEKDVSDIVSFLCSDNSSFITGQSIFVDGGLSAVGHESLARDLTDLSYEK